MIANQIDAARLRTFDTGLLSKAYLGADIETVDIGAWHAVAMEIDFAATTGGDLAVVTGQL